MTENRSLDDFLDSGDEADATDDASVSEPVDTEADAAVTTGDDSDGDDSDVVDDDSNAAETPRTTLRWTPDGVDCPACGARVERQWRDGDRFVCADCKEW